jgi:hypothetical protein
MAIGRRFTKASTISIEPDNRKSVKKETVSIKI